jgi:hypothetical protein
MVSLVFAFVYDVLNKLIEQISHYKNHIERGFSLLCELVHVLLIDRIVANLMGQLENGIIENSFVFEFNLIQDFKITVIFTVTR